MKKDETTNKFYSHSILNHRYTLLIPKNNRSPDEKNRYPEWH